METLVKWIGEMKFVGIAPSGHIVAMDSPQESGGANLAPSPMELVLCACGACTGMDVVSFLKKMREDLTALTIQISAQRQKEHPRVYTKIDLVYKLKGRNLNKENIAKAVRLSLDKYCSVAAMLKPACPISYKIELER